MGAVYDYGQRQKEEGKKEGIIEGIKEGKKEAYAKFVVYMIKKGESDEEIHKETNLTLEEIKQLRKNIKIQE